MTTILTPGGVLHTNNYQVASILPNGDIVKIKKKKKIMGCPPKKFRVDNVHFKALEIKKLKKFDPRQSHLRP